jgi:cobalt-zinc-cadmium efflux system outer membrane protein
MKTLFYLFISVGLLSSLPARSQKLMHIQSILDSIKANNPSMKMHDAEVRAMDEAAKGAKSWMAPEVSTGFFMVPYSPRYWESMAGEPGMGQFVVGVQQTIPNPKRLNADSKYMKSMSLIEIENKGYTLNQLYAEAKKSYYDWIILDKQNLILKENTKLLNYMIQSAEIRYKNGLEKLNAYYKAKAALAKVENMGIMLENEITKKKYILNALMYRDKTIDFRIDTAFVINDYQAFIFNADLFNDNRSDIKSIDKEISVNALKQETERTRLLPELGFRVENMYGWAKQPMQFTAMAMVRLPMVGWAAKMNKANIESLKWKNESLLQKKNMLINESTGMAYSMRTEILNKQKQIALYQEKILPALRRNYKAYQMAYEQNTEELFEVFDAWETLNITQLEYLKELQELLNMQVELERILQIR